MTLVLDGGRRGRPAAKANVGTRISKLISTTPALRRGAGVPSYLRKEATEGDLGVVQPGASKPSAGRFHTLARGGQAGIHTPITTDPAIVDAAEHTPGYVQVVQRGHFSVWLYLPDYEKKVSSAA